MLAPSLVLVQHVHVATTTRPSSGASALTAALLYAAVTGAGLLAAPVLTGAASNRRLRLAVAAALVVAEVASSGEESVFSYAFITLHLLTAAIWAGGVLYLALLSLTKDGRARLGDAIRGLSPWAVGSALTLVGTGYVLLRIDRVGLGSLGDSGFGRIVLVKMSLLAIAAALGLSHRFAKTQVALRQRPVLLRAEAGMLAGAVGLAGVLIGTVIPTPTLQMAGPGLAVVQAPNAPPEALLVTALDNGSGAVRVLSSEGIRLVDRTTDQAHQLGPGQAARVALDGNVARLAITSGLDTVNVSVKAGSPSRPPSDSAVTADPVSWMDYQLGRVLGLAAGGQASLQSPSSCAAPTPTADGVALGRELRRQHASRLAVFGDSSARAAALARGLARSDVRVSSLSRSRVALVATDANRARALLGRLADKPWVRAVYLAPWLLDGRVLSLLATTRLPPLLVASNVDAMSPLADRYRAALATVADGVPPSIAGLIGYADVVAPESVRSSRLTLYSASPVGFLPGVLDVGHDHSSAAGWFSGGTLVPTSAAAARPSSSCPTT